MDDSKSRFNPLLLRKSVLLARADVQIGGIGKAGKAG